MPALSKPLAQAYTKRSKATNLPNSRRIGLQVNQRRLIGMGGPIDSFDDEKLLLTYKSSQLAGNQLDEASQGETFLTG